MKAFYQKYKKQILFFAAFLVFCVIAGTVLNGEISHITIND